ncbi:nitrile hydratase subunit beta [Lentzea jiangxiensis]|uniref:nitrile hydratase subunit beta n=1 Tax=Lentzea jiangxiensis TaxID=641025 RepID=UPI00115FF2D5|nr:nitrile hydratase subunit beta [Lentzea jiangxiensis]
MAADPFTTGAAAFRPPNHRALGAAWPGLSEDRTSPPAGAPARGSAGRRVVGADSRPVGSCRAPGHCGRTTGRAAACRTGWGRPVPVLVVRGRSGISGSTRGRDASPRGVARPRSGASRRSGARCVNGVEDTDRWTVVSPGDWSRVTGTTGNRPDAGAVAWPGRPTAGVMPPIARRTGRFVPNGDTTSEPGGELGAAPSRRTGAPAGDTSCPVSDTPPRDGDRRAADPSSGGGGCRTFAWTTGVAGPRSADRCTAGTSWPRAAGPPTGLADRPAGATFDGPLAETPAGTFDGPLAGPLDGTVAGPLNGTLDRGAFAPADGAAGAVLGDAADRRAPALSAAAAVMGSSGSGSPILVPRLDRTGPSGVGAALRRTTGGPPAGGTADRTTGARSPPAGRAAGGPAPAVGGIAVNGSPSTGADRCTTAADPGRSPAAAVSAATTSGDLAPTTDSGRAGGNEGLATVNGGRTCRSWTAPVASTPEGAGTPDGPTPDAAAAPAGAPAPDDVAPAAPAVSPPPERFGPFPAPTTAEGFDPDPTAPERCGTAAATLLRTTGGTPESSGPAASPGSPGRVDPAVSRGHATSSGPPPE